MSVRREDLKALARKAKNLESQHNYVRAYREQFKRALEWYESPEIATHTKVRLWNWIDLAKAIVDKHGKAGWEIVKEGRKKSAVAAAERYAKRYGHDCEAIYHGYRDDIPWAVPVWDAEVDSKRLVIRMQCAIGNAIQDKMAADPAAASTYKELGRIYCDWDYNIPPVLNPKIHASRPKWIPNGDLYCEWIWEIK